MQQLIVLVPTVPLLTALLVQVASPRLGQAVSRLSVTGTAMTLLLTAILLWLAVDGQSGQVALADNWGILLFDPLSSLMAVVITGISLIVHIYSRRYMAEEPGYGRFFTLLDLMTAALLIMVTAGDLITLLVAWHLIGVLLYFLLGQNVRSHSAYRYGFWTFITYRIGDLPLILAAGILFHTYGTWSLPDIFEQLRAAPDVTTFLQLPLAGVIATLVALAAFARSAQIFLHTWLPYTMDGPTPVSALMHAGIVNAGGFLINRFAPVFVYTDGVLSLVFMVGLVTALIGSLLMLTQNDIKKSLGYSTMGQMGFMIMECGIGAFSLAIYHLIAHGVFKGTLFLSAGSIINAARHDDGVPKDELYTFVVERQPAKQRKPWMLMAAITLAVPVIILIFSHWIVSQDYFQKQSAIVLLFFGWITGAQLIFATYRMRTENIWRLVGLSVFSFTIVVMGYVLISHVFDLFLYPDPAFRIQIYNAAAIDALSFNIIVGLVTAIIVLGWVLTYYAEQNGNRHIKHRLGRLWLMFYSLVAHEFYLNDIYTRLTRLLMATAARLNVWLRWA
jgi:NADH-quinone oxidoreductase subunit L